MTGRRGVPARRRSWASLAASWLDFNQTAPRFPQNQPHNGDGGPFGGGLLAMQQLMCGLGRFALERDVDRPTRGLRFAEQRAGFPGVTWSRSRHG